MEEVIRRGDQVILLIPEISLTYQTVRRVSTRFQGRVAILNSRMSIGERFEQYTKCERGEVNVLIGNRVHIKVEIPRKLYWADRLGLLIMDEEHESAYKSETAPRYETRDVAYERARLAGCPVLYGSATPSLTIYSAALRGEVQLLELLERAHAGAQLAETEIIDLRERYPDLFRRALALEDNARANLKTVRGFGRNYSWKERFGKEQCNHGND